MIPFKISIEQYRGASYDIGYSQGKQMDQALLDMFSTMIDESEMDLDGLRDVYSLHAPHLLGELQGIADAMYIPFEQAALFGGYGALEIQGMGCSSIVNKNMLIRNYDFSPEVYDARLVFAQPKEGYASVGHSLHVTGRTEGVNEKGLAVALHFVNNDEAQNGLTAGSVVRIVLDTCKNTDEAVHTIKQLPHAWSYNFSIGDSSGHTVVVEESPFDIKVRSNQDVLFCTNHFQRKDMSSLNREHLENTEERLNYLSQRSVVHMDANKAFDMFRDAQAPLYSDAYRDFFGTLHTFAYVFAEDKILTAIPNGDILEIDFGEWVRGNDLKQTELVGYLNNL